MTSAQRLTEDQKAGMGVMAVIFTGLRRWDEGRWVKGSFILYALFYWGLFPIPHFPSSHLLSPLKYRGYIGAFRGNVGVILYGLYRGYIG